MSGKPVKRRGRNGEDDSEDMANRTNLETEEREPAKLYFGGGQRLAEPAKARLHPEHVALPAADGGASMVEGLAGASPALTNGDPIGGAVQENQRRWMREIIARLNDLFEGELTDHDRLVHLNDVVKGKLLTSKTLIRRSE